MNKYKDMSNIDTKKIQVKIGVISLKTLLILVIFPTMSFNLLQQFNFPLLESVIITVLVAGLALYCMATSKNNPVEGNYKLMAYAVVMNQKRYFPLDRIKSNQAKNKKSIY